MARAGCTRRQRPVRWPARAVPDASRYEANGAPPLHSGLTKTNAEKTIWPNPYLSGPRRFPLRLVYWEFTPSEKGADREVQSVKKENLAHRSSTRTRGAALGS